LICSASPCLHQFTPLVEQVATPIGRFGRAAWQDNALRGEFYPPENDNTRWESLKYRGVHLVEAFVIQRRDNRLAGQSEAFRVMIE
jgi:hypothetical protein